MRQTHTFGFLAYPIFSLHQALKECPSNSTFGTRADNQDDVLTHQKELRVRQFQTVFLSFLQTHTQTDTHTHTHFGKYEPRCWCGFSAGAHKHAARLACGFVSHPYFHCQDISGGSAFPSHTVLLTYSNYGPHYHTQRFLFFLHNTVSGFPQRQNVGWPRERKPSKIKWYYLFRLFFFTIFCASLVFCWAFEDRHSVEVLTAV